MRAIPVALALVAMLVAKRAAAEDLRLAWRAPAGCPSGERVREAALKSAGKGALEPLEAEARVERGEKWKVTIRTSRNGTAAEERTIEGASCAALADATAVILAIAMIPPGKDAAAAAARESAAEAKAKPTAGAQAQATGGASGTEAEAEVEADGDARTEAGVGQAHVGPGGSVTARGGSGASARDGAERPAGAARERHAFAGMVGGATDGTTLPAAALGGRVGLAWTPGRIRVELGGSFFSSQSKTTATSAAGARFNLLVAGARGCWALLQGAVEISPCAGVDVQSVSAKGFGATQNYDASGAWLSAAGGALVRVPLASWFALRADADAIVPFSRPTFVVEGDGAVHRPSTIGARAGIGAELLFL